MSSDTKVQKRATQERALQMQDRLQEAAMETILETGWHGATTRKISEAAGVSIGAQTNHYASKNELTISTLTRVRERFEKAQLQGDKYNGSLFEFLEGLGDAMIRDKDAYGTLIVEALVASRTDQELRRAFLAADKAWISRLKEIALATDRSGLSLSDSEVEALVEASLYFLRGLIAQLGVHRDQKKVRKLFKTWLVLSRAE